MESKHAYRKRFARRLAVLLAAGLLGTAAGTAFADATEVSTYKDLYSTLNSTETTEVSQTAGITLGENGLSINGSHSLNLNTNTLSQGATTGFTFVVPEGIEEVTALTISGGTGSKLDFTSLTNGGSTFGYLNISGMTDAFSSVKSINGLTLGLYNTSTASISTGGLEVTSGGLYVESGSTLTFNGALKVSESSTVEINHDYTNASATTIDASSLKVAGNFSGSLTAQNAASATITGDYSGTMNVSGLAAVYVNGATKLNGETLTVTGNKLDEESSTQYRSILSTPKITGKGTINLSDGGLLMATDGDDETSSEADDLLIQNDGGNLTMNITTDAGGYIQPAGALTINATGGNTLKINMEGAGWIQPQAGNLTLSADAGSTLTINAKGVYEDEGQTVDQAVFTTNKDAIVGGDGTINITLNDAASLDSCGNMTLGTGSGTVNINLEAANWGYMQIGVQGEETSKLTIGTETSTVNIKINTNNSVSGDAGIIAAADAGSTANITLNGGTLMGGSSVSSSSSYVYNDVVLGQNGKATLTGNGSIAAKNLIVGQNSGANGSVEMTGSIYAQNLVVGEAEGSNGSLKISGNTSTLTLYGSEEASTELTASGTGSITIDGLCNVNEENQWTSYAYLGANAQMTAGTITVKDSLLQADEDAKISGKDLTFTGTSAILGEGVCVTSTNSFTATDSYFSLGENASLSTDGTMLLTGSQIDADGTGTLSAAKGITFKNTLLNGTGLQVASDLELSGKQTFVVDLTGETENVLKVTDHNIQIADGSELALNFTGSGTATEFLIAEVEKTDESSEFQISGNWSNAENIETNLESGIFSSVKAFFNDDRTKQYIKFALNQDFFNVRADSLQMARQSLWSVVDDRISWNADSQAYCGPVSPAFQYQEKASTWVKTGYRGMDVKGARGYNVDAFHLALGVDCAFEENFAGGLFFSFSSPELEEDHETADAENYSAGFYLGYKWLAGLEFKGMMAYTLTDYDLNRNLGSLGTTSSSFYGSALTANVEVARPFYFGMFTLRPLFAIDTECVWQEAAVENGNYALVYGNQHETWTYARFGGKFDYTPMKRLNLRAKAFYAVRLDGSDATTSSARLLGSTDVVEVVGANPGNDYVNAGLSASFIINNYFTIFGNYDGYFASESETHLIHGGFQYNF